MRRADSLALAANGDIIGPGDQMVEFGSLTDKGMQRSENQDTLVTPPPELSPQVVADKGLLFIVADGMGGHAGGKVASDLAARVVKRSYYDDAERLPGPSLMRAVQAANAEVLHAAQEPAYSGMGTTIVAAVVLGRTLTVAHVGDSRAYLLRDEELMLLTEDHTWVAEQVRSGVLTTEQAQGHAQRHVLMRALGREPQVKVDVGQLELQPEDQLLLCCDGLWELVEPHEVRVALASPMPQEAAQKLVDLANDHGGPDNVTALVIRPLPAEETSEPPAGGQDRSVSPASLAAWLAELPRTGRIALTVGVSCLVLVVLVSLAVFFVSGSSAPDPGGENAPARVVPTQTLIPVAGTGATPADSAGQTPGISLTVTLQPVVNGAIVASAGANVRQGPSTDNAVLDTIGLHTVVRVLCWKGGAEGSVWYRVRYSSGAEGFVWSDLVELRGASHSDVQQCE